MKRGSGIFALKRKWTLKEYLAYFAPALVLTLASFAIAYQFVDPAPPRHITIATGQTSGAYYETAKKYSRVLARDGVTLYVKPTSGSAENLKLLADGNSGVDVVFVQGGVGASQFSDHFVSLGSLYFEPLWVFHRTEVPIVYLKDMQGSNISIGMEGSGTAVLTQQLLDLNEVTAGNSRILHMGDNEAVEKLLAGEIDVAFFVVAYRGHFGRVLFNSTDVRLFSFRRASAYATRLQFLSRLTLPEGAVDFFNNIPREDVSLLAPTAQLAVRKDFHPALIDLFLLAAKEVGSPTGVFEKPGEFPSPRYVDLPLSSDARRFYESGPPFLRRYLPFWIANFIDRMKIMLLPLLALFFPLMKLLPPFYQWRVRSRIYRWYDQLMEIDTRMLQGGMGEQIDEFMHRLLVIEQNVARISVPRGYTRELYDMRVHIEMLREKLIAAGADVCRVSAETAATDRRALAHEEAGPSASPIAAS